MKLAQDGLIAVLRDPAAARPFDLPAWERLILQARRANVLGKLAVRLHALDALESVPSAPRRHLVAALAQARAQRASVLREIEHVVEALAPTGCEIVLLKGSAYLVANLPAGEGRLFNDVDILVPRDRLPEVEAALMLRGWATTHLDAYDQRYYREWTHELPPMIHVTRGTTLDVHHAILPLTARLHPDSSKLLAAAREVPGHRPLRVLAPADMVVHSATHLFFNEELADGFRDLTDIDALLRDFGAQPGFWATLVARARALDLVLPLHYAIRYATKILGTPLPASVVADTARVARREGPQPIMDALFSRALQPARVSSADALAPLAHTLLYLRGHWLRMPPLMLARHLAIKAFRAESPSLAQAKKTPDDEPRQR